MSHRTHSAKMKHRTDLTAMIEYAKLHYPFPLEGINTEVGEKDRCMNGPVRK
ncbi:MAG: hypothetical protein DDT25_00361 [Chloroflexi bacterium]|nr:hypothetical protein [Chloroflexota bacterium]